MHRLKFLVLAAVAGIGLTANAREAKAQVGVEVGVGVAPDCPYGYYDVPPYACAPYGCLLYTSRCV